MVRPGELLVVCHDQQGLQLAIIDLCGRRPTTQNNTKEFNKDLQIIMGYGLTGFFQQPQPELNEQQRAATTKLLLKMLSYE